MLEQKAAYPVDLHSHTTNSDGNDTYEESIRSAAARGLSVLAITDHDVIPLSEITVDGRQVSPVVFAKELGLILLPATELSCDTNVDDVHIVGLGCDFSGKAFQEFEDSMSESKIRSYRKLTEVLCDNGMHVTWDMVLENNGKPLMDHQVQRKHIFEAMARAGITEDWSAAKILVRDNPEYNVKREKIDPVDAIALIHSAGGLAILAHPYLIDEEVTLSGKTVSRAEYIERLIQHGLDGIEAAYTYHKTTYKGKLSPEEIEQQVIQDYGHRLKIISGGSDYHDDQKKGMDPQKARQLGEKGITLEYFQNNPYLSKLA